MVRGRSGVSIKGSKKHKCQEEKKNPEKKTRGFWDKKPENQPKNRARTEAKLEQKQKQKKPEQRNNTQREGEERNPAYTAIAFISA